MSHVLVPTPDKRIETRPLLDPKKQKIFLVQRLWRHDCCPCLATRYVLAAMGFWGFLNVFLLRANLSMAIVQMVNDSSGESEYKAKSYKASAMLIKPYEEYAVVLNLRLPFFE